MRCSTSPAAPSASWARSRSVQASSLHSPFPAPVAQGIERCPAEAEVASSNLAGRIGSNPCKRAFFIRPDYPCVVGCSAHSWPERSKNASNRRLAASVLVESKWW